MGWEYKIFKNDLWYSIYRKKQGWKLLYVQYLNTYNQWSPIKTHSRVFYTEDSAVEALVIIKARWGNIGTTSNQTESSWGKREKSYWGEF